MRSPRGLTQSGRLHRDHIMEIQFHRNGPLAPWRGEVSLLGTLPRGSLFAKATQNKRLAPKLRKVASPSGGNRDGNLPPISQNH